MLVVAQVARCKVYQKNYIYTSVTGVTLNSYQVQHGNELEQADNNADCVSVQGDEFMKLPFAANEFEGAYSIEATCHAPDRVQCYQQIRNCSKPGTVFAV
jgi:sterol 24-C-methyltransferase